MNKKGLKFILTALLVLVVTGYVYPAEPDFRGTKGEYVELVNKEIKIAISLLEDGQAHYFNTRLPDSSIVYFFVIKSSDGKYRAALNGCQVCGGARQGFRQEGDSMVCNTCGNRYPLNRIATEKGGCNPAPINPDLKVTGGMVSITLADLEEGVLKNVY
ncbi:MAG: DUF2318 domain-containing protein [Candidatus Omnitrophota bacterium]|nr:DUF2318 domain-containing protein [Candidatus Omnitrophota bacterium]